MKTRATWQSGFTLPTLIWVVVGLVVVAAGIYAVMQLSSTEPSITVLAPKSGENWAVGTTQTIKWKTNNVPEGHKISITLRRVPPPPLQEEGQEFDPIVFVNLENTGSVEWPISNAYPSGTFVLSINSYESIPVTNPVSADSPGFTISGGYIIGGAKDAKGCLIAAGYSWCEARNECIRVWETYCTKTPPKTAIFMCEGGKTITAAFYLGDDKYVDLKLSDGRNISIPRAISASGARYAKPDESFVFWNKGDTAFITEGTTTYANCAEQN